MTSRLRLRLIELGQKLWVRATLFSVLGVASAFASLWLSPYLPEGLDARIGAKAVDNILNIVATSMLTVSTFSLSTMVAAYSAATTNVTPRATRLLMADPTTQNALATFIGSFLFSLVGIIALSIGVYGEEGRAVLFVVTLVVVGLIVVTLLRWIDHLSRLGRVNETTRTVEAATREALLERCREPFLGGRELTEADRERTRTLPPVGAVEIGYVRHVDLAGLEALAEEWGCALYLVARPGSFVYPGRALAYLPIAGSERADQVRDCFTIGDERDYAQDPLFGLAVMAEIASKALSPGINDPGTAIDVLGRCVRLLALWTDVQSGDEKPRFPHVHVPPLAISECFDHVFTPIGRDGAALVEVQLRIQKALAALVAINEAIFGNAARQEAHFALERAERGLSLARDRERVRIAASALIE